MRRNALREGDRDPLCARSQSGNPNARARPDPPEDVLADAIALATEYGNAARESRKAGKRQDERFFWTYQRRRLRPALIEMIKDKKKGLRSEESSDDQPEALEKVYDLAHTD